MVDLALHAGAGPVSRQDIAGRQGISADYVAQIFGALGEAGLVESVRGRSGGYRLTGDPKRTSLLEIYQAIDGRLAQSDCLFGRPLCPGGDCIFSPLVSTIRTMVSEHLSNTTLAVLAQRIRSKIDETTDHSN